MVQEVRKGFVIRWLFAVLLTVAAPAQAGWKSGNSLKEHCETEYPRDYGYCLGYIAGVMDGMEIAYAMRDADSSTEMKKFCIPQDVILGQVSDVVQGYLGRHPETRHWTASYLIVSSLIASFPCD